MIDKAPKRFNFRENCRWKHSIEHYSYDYLFQETTIDQIVMTFVFPGAICPIIKLMWLAGCNIPEKINVILFLSTKFRLKVLCNYINRGLIGVVLYCLAAIENQILAPPMVKCLCICICI